MWASGLFPHYGLDWPASTCPRNRRIGTCNNQWPRSGKPAAPCGFAAQRNTAANRRRCAHRSASWRRARWPTRVTTCCHRFANCQSRRSSRSLSCRRRGWLIQPCFDTAGRVSGGTPIDRWTSRQWHATRLPVAEARRETPRRPESLFQRTGSCRGVAITNRRVRRRVRRVRRRVRHGHRHRRRGDPCPRLRSL